MGFDKGITGTGDDTDTGSELGTTGTCIGAGVGFDIGITGSGDDTDTGSELGTIGTCIGTGVGVDTGAAAVAVTAALSILISIFR